MALFLLSSCLSVAAPSGALQRAAPAVLLGLGLFALDEQLHSPVVIAISLPHGTARALNGERGAMKGDENPMDIDEQN